MYIVTITTTNEQIIIVGIYDRISGAKGFTEEFKQILPSKPTITRRLKDGCIEYKNIIIETAGRDTYHAKIFRIQKVEKNQIININISDYE